MISKTHFNPNEKWRYLCITPELIENYDLAIADTNNMWICHHRLETHKGIRGRKENTGN